MFRYSSWMPRRIRIQIDGLPPHIVQRGQNRATTKVSRSSALYLLAHDGAVLWEPNRQLLTTCWASHMAR